VRVARFCFVHFKIRPILNNLDFSLIFSFVGLINCHKQFFEVNLETDCIRGCLKGWVRSGRVHSDRTKCYPRPRVFRHRAPVDAVAPSGYCRCHRSALPHSLGVASPLRWAFKLIEPMADLKTIKCVLQPRCNRNLRDFWDWTLGHYSNKPIGELARALPSFKRPLLSVDVMVGMYDSILAFLSQCGRAECFFSQSSKPNEQMFNTMFYDSGCLKGPHG